MKASFRYFAGISVTNEKRFVFVMLKYFRVICHTITWMNGKAVRVLQVVHKFRTQQFFKVRLYLTSSYVVHNFASTAGRQSRKLFCGQSPSGVGCKKHHSSGSRNSIAWDKLCYAFHWPGSNYRQIVECLIRHKQTPPSLTIEIFGILYIFTKTQGKYKIVLFQGTGKT